MPTRKVATYASGVLFLGFFFLATVEIELSGTSFNKLPNSLIPRIELVFFLARTADDY